jgi:tetrahydromethanopterin S-methyltransferase subunit G
MSDLEKTNLEVHVELCTSRFIRINERLDQIEKTLEKICDELLVNHKSQMKTVIMTAGTVIAGLLSTLVVLLMRS